MGGTESNTNVTADWIEIDLEMYESGLAVTLLRPPSWLGTADPDGDDVVELSVEEVSLHGPAHIVNVRPSAGVAAGPGRVVLSTIQHHSDVLALRIGDDEIHATANHRFYSADRNSWVAAGQLHEGELLQTTSGPASVGVTRESAKRVRVYNLQIEQDSETQSDTRKSGFTTRIRRISNRSASRLRMTLEHSGYLAGSECKLVGRRSR